ncbi:transcription elongation factor GreA [Candidatus Gottesmanbacteria bacterium RIFCSPLOWO2_01_FULL_48_11]|uniref:Transcription elongation factor GreA n=3 Tax=Candidatus Gottesmaniibacteriota TaxID=1752720 RepID=A0A0G1UPT5_9BACT|nr:MAG: Transcription elongation factor GreA [Candidatus Gottesmanbacteria bacterium GW2011_GWA2_47_9]KKU96139.1 MAG: Transcription elongation factor GreA [Candidatus Gottesmanbacteria bacterium GW2011_GWA1_48_13]OGG27311.1 MAG: transcription elongation factor GreA [Candidatus Gottesmanbacteria bacterium RIFCSPLOWO2_01_FULL_48_11]
MTNQTNGVQGEIVHRVLLTKEGLAQLKAEYEELVQKKRPDAVSRLSDARDLGDLSENSEYAAAKQDLAFIDGRIAELEDILHSAKVVTTHGKSQVDVGCKVTLHVNGKKDVFHLVGEWEADPKQKKISHESPLGKALLGKKVGEKVEVEAPAGKIQYKILDIE